MGSGMASHSSSIETRTLEASRHAGRAPASPRRPLPCFCVPRTHSAVSGRISPMGPRATSGCSTFARSGAPRFPASLKRTIPRFPILGALPTPPFHMCLAALLTFPLIAALRTLPFLRLSRLFLEESSASFDCPDSPVSCGSPTLPLLAVLRTFPFLAASLEPPSRLFASWGSPASEFMPRDFDA
jgi:hypothetical protein